MFNKKLRTIMKRGLKNRLREVVHLLKNGRQDIFVNGLNRMIEDTVAVSKTT